ncbi:DUF1835 domain-containing protein [Bacillus haynesii]|uniref:DUF1835 domain-containing protein n=1 Tax=Bacillus haynesii TaxID=1925021 RepID=UPI00227FC6F5|nr:DUF1835 domain-containing protein [Bacillus haynesii]MCY9444967.1 DUF1835 domain-containing protein [Bacillus haynesii]
MQNNVVHIAFGESARGSINMMLKQSGETQEKSLIVLPELFSIGPLQKLEVKEGRVNRYQWLKTHLNDRFHELGERYSRFEDAVSALSRIHEQASVFMWTGDHAHEQTGPEVCTLYPSANEPCCFPSEYVEVLSTYPEFW